MYPEEAVVVGAKGRKEVRILKSSGKDFVVYGYRDIKTENDLNKYSVLLRHADGTVEHFFIVSMGKRELVVKHAFENEKRAIYDEKKKTLIEF
jgi:hypothetical protein